MATGTVKFYDVEKGFGFIIPDDNSLELFMHKSKMPADIIGAITADARVSYEVGEHKGKKFATRVVLLAPAPVKTMPVFKPPPKPDLDFEEEFEREWGLRRAK